MKRISRFLPCALALLLSAALLFSGCSAQSETAELPDYTDSSNWAYLETDKTAQADVFFICPTVYGGDEAQPCMSLDDAEAKESFLGATNMEKGIYDENARFFAPYYRQAGLWAYSLSEEQRAPYLDSAYADVSKAFQTYLDEYDTGSPIVLAGFSQGADLAIRLVRDFFDEPDMAQRLVACYAIGWRLTEEEVSRYPQLVPASGESDTGVIITFSSEDVSVSDSLIVPAGTKTYSINPLNWKTDAAPADKSLNLGACFTDYSGGITQEIPQLTGAYIDPVRGTLKVTDIDPADYPPGLDIFGEGEYHLYDYQFFYRNLQENVNTRLAAYEADAAA